MQDSPENPWKTISRKSIYSNPWIKVEEHHAINPGDQECLYGLVRFQNIAVGILPLTDDHHTYLVGQHRYPLDLYSWEIPEGGSPLNTSPLDSAKRELKEETGLIAQDYQELMRMYLSNSVTDELAIVYVAKNLSQHESELESSENITVRKLPFEEVFQMVMRGDISDSITVGAILKAKQLIQSGLL